MRPRLTNVGQIATMSFVNGWIMMKQLNLAEAKAKLSHLVDQAARGKGVIIAKFGIPMAKLVPLDDEEPQKFKFGTLKSVFTDDLVKAIEAPLPDDLLDAMVNGTIDPGEGK
jgi:prevent-host-death family protein